jgi:two-component system sensor histidine kinase YesM
MGWPLKTWRFRVRKYGDWSIRLKLLVITALLLLGSVFLESVLSYWRYTHYFEAQTDGQIRQTIEQVALNVDTYLDDLFRLTLAPYHNDTVMRSLEENVRDSDLEQLEKTRLVEGYLDGIMIYPRSDILRVILYTDELYVSQRIPLAADRIADVLSKDWYTSALASQEPVFIPGETGQTRSGPELKLFSVARQIRSTTDSRRLLGVIKVDANYRGIADICDKVDLGAEGGLFVVDGNGNVIYASGPDRVREAAFPAEAGSAQTTKPQAAAGARIVHAGGKTYVRNEVPIPRANWTIVSMHSREEWNRQAVETRNAAFGIAIGCSFLALIVLFLFVQRFLKPLLAIVRLMKDVERGRLNVSFPHPRQDEIGYLGRSFNAMVRNIREMLERNTELVKEVYEAKLLQKEAQIRALFNQIRPHFLFNTLNMISMLMQSGRHDKAVRHLQDLSGILRAMTRWDQEVPLRREIELLEAYLGIQSSRYDGRLVYEIGIPASVYELRVPYVLFQPIVENAVIHGCEAKKERTTIRIGCEIGTDRYRFVVEDDGVGMDADTLARLRERLAGSERPEGGSNDSGGIGLVNVHRRIRIRYGAEYGLTIDSAPGAGTRVAIDLPKDAEREGTGHV